jgi:hypothetical protein
VVARTALHTLRRDSGDDRNVAYLIWNDGKVLVNWNWLDNDWNGNNPALLANLIISLLPLWWGSFVFISLIFLTKSIYLAPRLPLVVHPIL